MTDGQASFEIPDWDNEAPSTATDAPLWVRAPVVHVAIDSLSPEHFRPLFAQIPFRPHLISEK